MKIDSYRDATVKLVEEGEKEKKKAPGIGAAALALLVFGLVVAASRRSR